MVDDLRQEIRPDTAGRAEILKYFLDTNARWVVYHNHKELMAWAGIVAYYGFIAAFVGTLRPTKLDLADKYWASAVLLSVTVLIFLVIRKQHHLAFIASQVNAACQDLAFRCLTMSAAQLGTLELGVHSQKKDDTIGEPLALSKIFPACIVRLAPITLEAGTSNRKQLEYLSYGLIGVGAIVAAVEIVRWHW